MTKPMNIGVDTPQFGTGDPMDERMCFKPPTLQSFRRTSKKSGADTGKGVKYSNPPCIRETFT